MTRLLNHVGLLALPLLAALPSVAQAQDDSTLIVPTLPPGFDRGRNVSVTDKARPDYDPLGISAGGFNIFPRLETGVGYSSNVLLEDDDNKDSDGYVVVAPSIRAESDWAVHQASLRAGLDASRYFSTRRRNQTNWYLGGRGRYDYSEAFSLSGDAQVEKRFETPFSGAIPSDLTVLSSYIRSYGAVRGDYRSGQFRTLVSADLSHYKFNRIRRADGSILDQSDRDRDIGRLTGQLEYALTPSSSVYGRVGYDRISYDELLRTGEPNRDANGFRGSVGVNVDLAGLLRGTLGIGYVRRDYDAGIYKDANGLSAEARLEYFYTELTTFTLEASRTIQDANIGNVNAFFDNRISIRADHELLRNLILNVGAEYSHQRYISTDNKNNVWQVSGGARYLATRLYHLEADLSYTDRSAAGNLIGRDFNELRGLFSVVVHP